MGQCAGQKIQKQSQNTSSPIPKIEKPQEPTLEKTSAPAIEDRSIKASNTPLPPQKSSIFMSSAQKNFTEAANIEQIQSEIHNQHEDDEDDIFAIANSQIMYSTITKLGSKGPKNNSEPPLKKSVSTIQQEILMTEIQGQEELDGRIIEEEYYSKIQIYNSKVNMQFTLPKSKAGPLVVPSIDYSLYEL